MLRFKSQNIPKGAAICSRKKHDPQSLLWCTGWRPARLQEPLVFTALFTFQDVAWAVTRSVTCKDFPHRARGSRICFLGMLMCEGGGCG